jgi:hypothetical protein
MDPHVYAEPWDSVIRLLESSGDVMTFIHASSQIQVPSRHTHRTTLLTPISV